jgi:hypothetical protein
LQKKVSDSGWNAVDLDEVKTKLASVIEEQRANDPAELKKELRHKNAQIAKLEKELVAFANRNPESKPEIKEVSVFDKHSQSVIDQAVDRFEKVHSAIEDKMDACRKIYGELQTIRSVLAKKMAVSPTALQAGRQSTKPVAMEPRRSTVATRSVPPSVSDSPISGGLRRMMIALAQRPGLNKRQLGVRAGLSSTSGTFGTYLGRLRSSNWIEGDGNAMQLTSEGLAALGDHEPLPEGQDLLAYWLNELGDSGAGRMLRALADIYPNSFTREQLGAQADISHSSGTFGTYLGKLRTLELIEGKGELTAAKEFFE